MHDLIKSFLVNEAGATAVEYALIAGTMATILIAAFAILTTDFETVFTRIGAAIQ